MITKFYLTCTFLFAICTTNAQEPSVQEADSLFAAKQYFEASVEYERVLFSATDQQLRLMAINRNIQCFKQQRLFEQAVKFLKYYVTGNLPDSNRYQLFTEQVVCSYLAGHYHDAVAVIEQIKLQFPEEQPGVKILLIETLSLNRLQEWEKAAVVFTTLTSHLKASPDFENPYLAMPRLKNVEKAKWLATFIPGAGQIYAGKPWEALVSIVIQGAGLYYGVLSFQQHYYLSAWLVGAGILGSFHMGGVRRSEVLVSEFNTKAAERFNKHVEDLLLQWLSTTVGN